MRCTFVSTGAATWRGKPSPERTPFRSSATPSAGTPRNTPRCIWCAGFCGARTDGGRRRQRSRICLPALHTCSARRARRRLAPRPARTPPRRPVAARVRLFVAPLARRGDPFRKSAFRGFAFVLTLRRSGQGWRRPDRVVCSSPRPWGGRSRPLGPPRRGATRVPRLPPLRSSPSGAPRLCRRACRSLFRRPPHSGVSAV